MSTQQTYFFSQDNDSHWYMIPVEKLHRWRHLSKGSDDDEDNNDAINSEFGEYRTGGGIDNILFIPIMSKRNEPRTSLTQRHTKDFYLKVSVNSDLLPENEGTVLANISSALIAAVYGVIGRLINAGVSVEEINNPEIK